MWSSVQRLRFCIIDLTSWDAAFVYPVWDGSVRDSRAVWGLRTYRGLGPGSGSGAVE